MVVAAFSDGTGSRIAEQVARTRPGASSTSQSPVSRLINSEVDQGRSGSLPPTSTTAVRTDRDITVVCARRDQLAQIADPLAPPIRHQRDETELGRPESVPRAHNVEGHHDIGGGQRDGPGPQRRSPPRLNGFSGARRCDRPDA
jgi:hypothetical protein